MKISFFILLFIFSLINIFGQDVVINEFMSSNYNFLLDYDGDDNDWIEIYNPTDDTINLSSYFISDNPKTPYKWSFPDIEIAPDSFLVIFASGKDTVYPGNEIHTSFSIKSYGESLLLTNDFRVVQEIEPVILRQNQSYGFLPDASDEAVIFDVATPGTKNELILIEKVFFSKSGGIYDDNFEIELSNVFSENEIRFTIDGNMPDKNSLLYSNALFLDEAMCSKTDIYKIQISPAYLQYIPENLSPKAIVIRAAAFDSSGVIQSKIVTNSYFIRNMEIDHLNLPIISITADYYDLFDDSTGIFVPGIYYDENHIYGAERSGNYYQRGEAWERRANIELFDYNNSDFFSQEVGLRIHGDKARRFPQKGMRVYARNKYGEANFYTKLFTPKEYQQYKRLVFKPFYSSWTQAGFEDFLTAKISTNLSFINPNSKPVVLYLNGEYWGIYFMLKRIDEKYLTEKYDIDENSVELVYDWFGNTDNGVSKDFTELYKFISENDMKNAENYYNITQQIDINNFIDYQIFEIYFNNYDWPANNMKCWKSNQYDQKWRWIFYDGDACFNNYKDNFFNHATNTSDDNYPTNYKVTLFFRKLMENSSFAFAFVNRLQYLVNNDFLYVNTTQYFNQINSFFDIELYNQINRFNKPSNYNQWLNDYENIQNFLIKRPCSIKKHLKSSFGYTISVPNCDYIDDIKDNYVAIYPNPTQASFGVLIKSDYSCPIRIIISDITGKVIQERIDFLQMGDNRFYFDKLKLEAGVYFVNCYYLQKVVSKKLVVIR
ncbi:MAG: CotH kinase family protein [Bacteroidales bacterium]|nr:CotH kinase family protein [Bacteroidales bacterium]